MTLQRSNSGGASSQGGSAATRPCWVRRQTTQEAGRGASRASVGQSTRARNPNLGPEGPPQAPRPRCASGRRDAKACARRRGRPCCYVFVSEWEQPTRRHPLSRFYTWLRRPRRLTVRPGTSARRPNPLGPPRARLARQSGMQDSHARVDALEGYVVQPIGVVRSTLRVRDDAPNQAFESAPSAQLDIDPAFEDALHRIQVGDETDPAHVAASRRPRHPSDPPDRRHEHSANRRLQDPLARPTESDRRPPSRRHRARGPDETASGRTGGDRRHADHRPQSRDARIA